MSDAVPAPPAASAARLNQRCFCVTLDRAVLREQLQAQLGEAGAGALLDEERGQILSDSPVFVPAGDVTIMEQAVRAIEETMRLPAVSELAFAQASDIARFDPGPVGAFMGYDFHLGDDGPKLIEVNTNAGGAFINAQLARAQRACCTEASQSARTRVQLDSFDDAVVRMFEDEWRRQRSTGRPARIAIVDDAPAAQFMFPEFRLAQGLLEAHGIHAVIADPAELHLCDGVLSVGGTPVDLVYNRLVDFALAAPAHEVLREAYLSSAVVVTPNPHVHALLADKRNLDVLSDPSRLERLGVPDASIKLLSAVVPRTLPVVPAMADALWQSRREWFFKPATGHGSKGAYRGSKLTRGTFARILKGGYVAQAFVPPSERQIRREGSTAALKVDVRLYTYAGRTLLVAARTYEGQATNLRTPGGGFAPVFQV